MSVIQVALDLPPEIQKGLLEGTLVRCGGVIRNASGKIVKHLQDAPLPKVSAKPSSTMSLPATKATGGLQKVGKFVKRNKSPIILISVAVLTATAATIVYVKSKKKNNSEADIPDFLDRFDNSFSCYITCIKNGNMTEATINELLNSISELEKNQESGSVSVTVPVENSELLIGLIKGYTEKLASANNYECTLVNNSNDELQLLKYYLNVQKDIFQHFS